MEGRPKLSKLNLKINSKIKTNNDLNEVESINIENEQSSITKISNNFDLKLNINKNDKQKEEFEKQINKINQGKY